MRGARAPTRPASFETGCATTGPSGGPSSQGVNTRTRASGAATAAVIASPMSLKRKVTVARKLGAHAPIARAPARAVELRAPPVRGQSIVALRPRAYFAIAHVAMDANKATGT